MGSHFTGAGCTLVRPPCLPFCTSDASEGGTSHRRGHQIPKPTKDVGSVAWQLLHGAVKA